LRFYACPTRVARRAPHASLVSPGAEQYRAFVARVQAIVAAHGKQMMGRSGGDAAAIPASVIGLAR
jgi:hypothetical protein